MSDKFLPIDKMLYCFQVIKRRRNTLENIRSEIQIQFLMTTW